MTLFRGRGGDLGESKNMPRLAFLSVLVPLPTDQRDLRAGNLCLRLVCGLPNPSTKDDVLIIYNRTHNRLHTSS